VPSNHQVNARKGFSNAMHTILICKVCFVHISKQKRKREEETGKGIGEYRDIRTATKKKG
jgi:hypothetical protein